MRNQICVAAVRTTRLTYGWDGDTEHMGLKQICDLLLKIADGFETTD